MVLLINFTVRDKTRRHSIKQFKNYKDKKFGTPNSKFNCNRSKTYPKENTYFEINKKSIK